MATSSTNIFQAQEGDQIYQQIKASLDHIQLGYLGSRLPPNAKAAELNLDGSFKITFNHRMEVPVTREGIEIRGAWLKVEEVVEGRLEASGIVFKEGISGSGLGVSAKVSRIDSDKSGNITMTAEGPFGFQVIETFNPNKEKSVLGGFVRFDPKDINVKYNQTTPVLEKPSMSNSDGSTPSDLLKTPPTISRSRSWSSYITSGFGFIR